MELLIELLLELLWDISKGVIVYYSVNKFKKWWHNSFEIELEW